MHIARVLVIGVTLAAALGPSARADDLGDAAADAASDTAASLLGLPPADEPDRPDVDPKTINVAQCRRIAKQISHFETVKDRAEDRDNVLWAKATQDHIDRLESQWWTKCDDGEDEFAKAFSRALKTAARVAVKYFTFGAY